MHYEIWDVDSGNLIAAVSSQGEALRLARTLLQAGWSEDHLSIGAVPDPGESDAGLPPSLHGAQLRERVFGIPA